jgi:hypothetical protein
VLAYDVSTETYRRETRELRASLAGESFRLFILRTAPGVVWTNSSVQVQSEAPSRLELEVRGPAELPGFLHVYVPAAPRVFADEAELRQGIEYTYSPDESVLRVFYGHETPHRIEITW